MFTKRAICLSTGNETTLWNHACTEAQFDAREKFCSQGCNGSHATFVVAVTARPQAAENTGLEF